MVGASVGKAADIIVDGVLIAEDCVKGRPVTVAVERCDDDPEDEEEDDKEEDNDGVEREDEVVLVVMVSDGSLDR